MPSRNNIRICLFAFAIIVVGCCVFIVPFRAILSVVQIDRSLESLPRDSRDVREFVAMFPTANCFISYHTGEYGEPTWNGVLVTPQFELNAQMRIRINRLTGSAVSDGPLSITVLEIASNLHSPGGTRSISYSGGTTMRLEDLIRELQLNEGAARSPFFADRPQLWAALKSQVRLEQR